ncbi:MAG: hypothetical protein ABI680_06880 [Chthoniobacteraceae bacterium]
MIKLKYHRCLACVAAVLLAGCVTSQSKKSPTSTNPQLEDITDANAQKLGYIRSPSNPSAGFIDVRGFKKGQAIRDPFTQKVFVLDNDYSHIPPPSPTP